MAVLLAEPPGTPSDVLPGPGVPCRGNAKRDLASNLQASSYSPRGSGRRMTGRRRSIPWDEEGFLAAFARWQDLVATPPASRGANPMASYFVERYGRTRGLAHLTRWVKIGGFLARPVGRRPCRGPGRAPPGGR